MGCNIFSRVVTYYVSCSVVECAFFFVIYKINKEIKFFQTVLYSVFQGFRQAKSALCFDFKLEPIFDTALTASKNEAHCKSGQS